MFEILSPGQKLKKLRKELHITQSELASGAISREFISMVEHGLRDMSPEVAHILYKNLKDIFESKNMAFNYDRDYLTRNFQEELLYQCKNLDPVLSPEILISFKSELAQFNNLSTELLLNFEIGKRFLELKRLNESLEYMRKAYDLAIQLQDKELLMRSSNNLGHIKSTLNESEEAISYFYTALELAEDVNTISAIEYNIIMTLYTAGEFKKVQKEIENIEENKIVLTDEFKNHFLNIQGLVFLQNDELQKAREIFQYLLNIHIDQELRSMVLSNLSEVELQSKNFSLAENLNRQSAELRSNQPALLEENILNSAHILYDSNQPEEAAKILERYIKKSDSPRLGNAYSLLLDIYQSQNETKKYLKVYEDGLSVFFKMNQPDRFLSYLAKGSCYLGETRSAEYYSLILPYLNRFNLQKSDK